MGGCGGALGWTWCVVGEGMRWVWCEELDGGGWLAVLMVGVRLWICRVREIGADFEEGNL